MRHGRSDCANARFDLSPYGPSLAGAELAITRTKL